jgi:hypothetical protein
MPWKDLAPAITEGLKTPTGVICLIVLGFLALTWQVLKKNRTKFRVIVFSTASAITVIGLVAIVSDRLSEQHAEQLAEEANNQQILRLVRLREEEETKRRLRQHCLTIEQGHDNSFWSNSCFGFQGTDVMLKNADKNKIFGNRFVH